MSESVIIYDGRKSDFIALTGGLLSIVIGTCSPLNLGGRWIFLGLGFFCDALGAYMLIRRAKHV